MCFQPWMQLGDFEQGGVHTSMRLLQPNSPYHDGPAILSGSRSEAG